MLELSSAHDSLTTRKAIYKHDKRVRTVYHKSSITNKYAVHVLDSTSYPKIMMGLKVPGILMSGMLELRTAID